MIGHVGVEQRQVELDVQRLFEQLARQIHPRLGCVEVAVEIEDQVVRDDRVAGGEERDEPLDQVALRGGHPRQIGEVGREVDLLDRPGVLDRRAVHLEEPRIGERPQRQAQPGVEQPRGHWHASQVSGFSSEHAMASTGAASATVVLPIFVAGRERR